MDRTTAFVIHGFCIYVTLSQKHPSCVNVALLHGHVQRVVASLVDRAEVNPIVQQHAGDSALILIQKLFTFMSLALKTRHLLPDSAARWSPVWPVKVLSWTEAPARRRLRVIISLPTLSVLIFGVFQTVTLFSINILYQPVWPVELVPVCYYRSSWSGRLR